MSAVQDNLVTSLDLVGLGGYTGGLTRAADAFGILGAASDATGARLLRNGMLAGAGAAALGAGVGRAIREAGKLEQVKIGFTTMLGGDDEARAKIAELQRFAKKTPFNFTESARGAQMLIGFGAAAEQTTPIMTALGNAVSASGRGTEEYGRAILAVSQMISSGKLMGGEVRQLAEAGVPVKEWLDRLGVSVGKVGEAGVPADRALKALIETLTTGRFAGAMDAQSRTLLGSWSSLEDAAQQLGAAVGEPLVGPLGAATRGVTVLLDAVNAVPGPVKAAFGPVAVGAMIGFGGYALWTAGKLVYLTKSNIELTNSQLRSAGAARTQAAALREVAAAASLPAGYSPFAPGVKVPIPASARSAGAAAGVLGANMAVMAPAARAGLGARAMGALRKGGTPAMLAGGLALGFAPDEGGLGTAKRLGQVALTGGAIGSLIPGVGTAIGAGVGLAGAGIAEALREKPKREDPGLAEQRRTNDLLRSQLAELQGLRRDGKVSVSTSDVPGAWQMRATMAGSLERALRA